MADEARREAETCRTVTASELREHLAEMVSQAAFANEPVVITRNGKRRAALISYRAFEFYLKVRAFMEDQLDAPRVERAKMQDKFVGLDQVKKELESRDAALLRRAESDGI